MKTFSLKIRTPEKMVVSEQVEKLLLRAADGEIEILPDHASLATIIAPGQIRYLTSTGEAKNLDGGPGFLLINNNQVNVLLKGEINV